MAMAWATRPARCENRVALVIGNSAYQSVPLLPNPANDAMDMAAALGRLGFGVKTVTDANYDGMRRALIEFGDRAQTADVAVIFFAGHGIQIGGENWLIPVDAKLATDLNVANEAIGLQALTRAVSNATRLGLVILDSCRSNPFLPKMKGSNLTRAVERGFSRVEPSDNVLVAYAARDGTTANDGAGRNSPFTQSLLKNIERPGIEITFLFRVVRDDVMKATHREQQPFLYGSLSSEQFYLKPAAPSPPPSSPDQIFWEAIKNSNTPALFEEFMKRYPESRLAADAKSRLAALAPKNPVAAPRPEPDTALRGTIYGTSFVAGQAPFICDKCRTDLKAEVKRSSGHVAVVLSLDGGHYVASDRRSTALARTHALGACLRDRKLDCFVYAMDDRIVWAEPLPAMPAKPWFKRDAATEQPLDISKLRGVWDSDKARLAQLYAQFKGRALAVGPWYQWATAGQSDSADEAARLALERCGYITRTPCQIVGIDQSMVVPLDKQATGDSAVVNTPAQKTRANDTSSSELTPFVCDECRDRVRKLLVEQTDHSAIVISLEGGLWFGQGRASLEEARARALGSCLGANQLMCFVYALDGKVVWNELTPVLPKQPWFTHDSKPEKVLDPERLTYSQTSKQWIAKVYLAAPEPKAIATTADSFATAFSRTGQIKSETEAARLALEQCSFITRDTCSILAINNKRLQN